MSTFLDIFTQGGQTQLHKLHMIRQVVGSTLKGVLILFVLTFGLFIYMNHCWQDFWLLLCYVKARLRIEHMSLLPRGFFDESWLVDAQGVVHTVTDFHLFHSEFYQNLVGGIWFSLLRKFIFSIFISFVGFFILSWFWVKMGKKRQQVKIIKGFSLVEPKVLKNAIRKIGVSPYTIAGIPYPNGSEFQHTMVTGTTGSGKSNMIHLLLEQIRANGDQAIIVDTTGGLFSRFFEENKDILLNPLDARSANWDMFSDIEDDCLIEEISETIVSDTRSLDSFWTSSSRQILCETLRYLKANQKKTYTDLLDMLIKVPLTELYGRLKKTLVAPLLDPTIDKTSTSLRATLANHLRVFQFLDDQHDFSIMKEMKTFSDKWYFLSCDTSKRALLRPVFSTFLSLMIKGIMTRSESNQTRTWIIIDELASLNKLPSLLTGLAEIRKYGGCFVLGFQDLSQIEAIYGIQEARTLSNLTANKIVFKMTDADVAAKVSRFFGEHEKEELSTSISYGAHTMRDGVNLNQNRQTKPLVSASDVMMLENLSAYLKFSATQLVTKVQFSYKSYEEISITDMPKAFTHLDNRYLSEVEEALNHDSTERIVHIDFKNKGKNTETNTEKDPELML